MKIFCAVFLILLSSLAFADDTNPLIGKWAEKFKNGNMMVMEFTENTILSYPADASGKATKSSTPSPIQYKSLGHDTQMGDGYAIEFKNSDGTTTQGGGIMIYMKDHNTAVMDFPGMGTHTLTRIN